MIKNSLDTCYKIEELDQYLFGQGTHYEIYKKLGAHLVEINNVKGVYFAVWAPNAKSVSVVGDFNNWKPEIHTMERLDPIGIYTCFIEGVKEYECYKYCIETFSDSFLFKADPFAYYAEVRPHTASKVADISNIKWSDTKWLEHRKQWDHRKEPISIYEVHIGSWMRHDRAEEESLYNYREFAVEIVKYVKKMGYTHIELMGVAEHPYDGSWGYQVTGYYAPTARYGTPEDFAFMVNYLHKHKIGVILDWVPAHFTKDAHGLADFDGSKLYEYADSRKGEHLDWGTKVFDYGKNEVSNFLIANALFWIECFHIDGLRVDAVSSMLYLDYGRNEGEWIPNIYGENKNLEVIEFFKHLNSIIHQRCVGALMIAEESTAWEMVTAPVEEGGLGFDLKWNMGWMHDFTEYMKLDPYFRKDNHHKMTFAMSYNYSEQYMLVLSHDEVVHMKCSMLNKMPGIGVDKFKNLMVGYAFMMTHPGKKLLFMGQDFGQLREWSEKRELDWYLLQEPEHQYLQLFVQDLLKMYKRRKALYETDTIDVGFQWINADDAYRSIYSFIRYSSDKKRGIVVVCNLTPVDWLDYRVGVEKTKQHKLILDSNDIRYGGEKTETNVVFKPKVGECDGKALYIEFPLLAYGVAIFEF